MRRMGKENRDKNLWKLSGYGVLDLVGIYIFEIYAEGVWEKRIGGNLELGKKGI